MRHKNFFDGVVLGIAISSTLILTSLWASSLPNSSFQANFIPLLTAAATLGAGFLAISAATRTINAQSSLLEKARLNKLEAARSTLPLVLSRVMDISGAHVICLKDGTGRDNLPALDNDSITVLKECIETSEGTTRSTLQEMMAAYQICKSRFEGVKSFMPAEQNQELHECLRILHRAIDWIALSSLASAAFDFSRGRSTTPNRDAALEYAIGQSDIFVADTNWQPNVRSKVVERHNQIKEAGSLSFANPDWLHR